MLQKGRRETGLSADEICVLLKKTCTCSCSISLIRKSCPDPYPDPDPFQMSDLDPDPDPDPVLSTTGPAPLLIRPYNDELP